MPRAAGPLSLCLLMRLHYLMSCLLCLLCCDVLQVQGLMYIFDCEWCNLYIWTSQRGSAGGWVGGWWVVLLAAGTAAAAVGGGLPRAKCASSLSNPASHACLPSSRCLPLAPCSVPHPAGPRLLGPPVGRAGRLLVEPRGARSPGVCGGAVGGGGAVQVGGAERGWGGGACSVAPPSPGPQQTVHGF